jgi:type IV secretion system protein VirB5
VAAALVWRASQAIVTPYVVEVDRSGQIRAVGEAITPYRPSDAQIAFHLAHFISDVRSLATDPVVVRQSWLAAYGFTTDQGAVSLNEYARANDPFSRIGQVSVVVDVTSVVRASESSFQVRWIERTYVHGSLATVEHWTGILSIVVQPPRTEERLRRNPLGIYVNGLSWSKELTAAEGKSP